MMKRMLLIGLLVIMAAIFVIADSDSDETVTVTLDSPAASSTVENFEGWYQINCSATATAPQSNATYEPTFQNISLFLNITDNQNYTQGFNTNLTEIYTLNANNQTYDQALFNGTSNSTSFNWTLMADDEYATFNCRVCTINNNCSFATANYSFKMNHDYDTTDPEVSIVTPTDKLLWGKDLDPFINVSITDDTYIKNITLWINYTDDSNESHNLTGIYRNWTKDLNITYNSNETILNYNGTQSLFKNDGNTTIFANFSNWTASRNETVGEYTHFDGYYFIHVIACDYNGNCGTSDNVSFSMDVKPPNMVSLVNASVGSTCNTFGIRFNTTDIGTNYTLTYSMNISNLTASGVHTVNWTQCLDADNLSVSRGLYNCTQHYLNLTNLQSHRKYFWNLTIWDEAGNVNYTNGSIHSFFSDYALCEGWNSYGIANDTMRLIHICAGVNNNCTSVSWFNETSQSFVNYIANLTTNENYTIDWGEAFYVYTDTDSFIKPNDFMQGNGSTIGKEERIHFVNTSSGNWTNFGTLHNWQLGNFSTAASGIGNNITAYSYWDPIEQRYVDYIYQFLMNNNTEVRRHESVWVLNNKFAAYWYRNDTYENSTEDVM